MSKTTPNLKDGERLVDKILGFYQKNGVIFDIRRFELSGIGYKFNVKVKKGTDIEKMRRLAPNARLYLRVDRFEVVQEDFFIYIYLTERLPNPRNWLKVLSNQAFIDAHKHMDLIHPIGIDSTGKLVAADLTKYPHALVAGSSGSGKTYALKNLLVNLAGTYSPSQLNLIVGDMSGDLNMFSLLPHLSYPIVKEPEILLKVMPALHDELERRIKLKNALEYHFLSKIVCIIDEFTTFVSELELSDKKHSSLLVKTINDILQRGRHASIHLILATHNPTKESIKISTCNIPTRLVFRVANINNSVTALGKKGAESLKGNGDMFFSMNGDIQHLQGIYITDEDIKNYVGEIKFRYWLKSIKGEAILSKPAFVITNESLYQKEVEMNEIIYPAFSSRNGQASIQKNDTFLAKVIVWTLQQDNISANRIDETFKVGWRKAKEYINRLQELGIVDDLNAKLPRTVLTKAIDDLSEDAMNILNTNGISNDAIVSAISQKKKL